MCLNIPSQPSGFLWVQFPAGIWQSTLAKALLGMIIVENEVGIRIRSDSLQIVLLYFFSQTLKTASPSPFPSGSGHRCNWDGKKFLRQTGNFVESQLSQPLGSRGSQGSAFPQSCVTTHIVPHPSFSPSAPKINVFCKTHLERIPEYPVLPGNSSEPPTYCIQVDTCERSEQMFQGSDRISCLPKNQSTSLCVISLSPKTDGLINCLHIQLNLKSCA